MLLVIRPVFLIPEIFLRDKMGFDAGEFMEKSMQGVTKGKSVRPGKCPAIPVTHKVPCRDGPVAPAAVSTSGP